MKRLSLILGILTALILGYGFYLIGSLVHAQVAPIGKVIMTAVMIVALLGLIIGTIFGLCHFADSKQKARELFRIIMLVGWMLLLLIFLVTDVWAHGIVKMILGNMGNVQIVTVSEETAKQETWQPNFTSVGNLDPVQGADISNQVA